MSESEAERDAALTTRALQDEIEADARAERHLLTIGAIAAAVTAALVVLRWLS